MTKTIHFIYGLWDKSEMPITYKNNLSTWRSLNPDWTIKIWNRSMIQNLVEQLDGGKWKHLFSLKLKPIQYCDISRILIIYSQGGVYSDLDVVPKLPLHKLNIMASIKSKHCIIGVEFPYERKRLIELDHINRTRVRVILTDTRPDKLKWKTVPGHHLPKIRNGIPERLPRICNYFFASPPGHMFLKNCLYQIRLRIKLPIHIEYDILYTTGPDIFSEALAMKSSRKIRLLSCKKLRSLISHQCSSSWRWQ